MITKQKMITFETKMGKRMVARPFTHYDAPYLVDIFQNMSPESRYSRFQQTLENPNPRQIWQEAEKIAQMDEEQQGGFIAFWQRPLHADIPVAAARYVRLDRETAEIAISVRDDMHGQGIGTWLLGLAVAEARTKGIRTLVGSVLNNNDALWRILDKLGYPYTRKPEGTSSEIAVDLTGEVTISVL